MIRLTCPKCNNQISSTDTKCINCGLDMTTIEYELKKQELIKKGTIKDTSKKKKAIIVFIELVVFLTISIIYYQLFIPKILDLTDERKQQNKIQNCENQGGFWDNTINDCNYENSNLK